MFDIATKMNENKYFALDWAFNIENKVELSEVERDMSKEIDVWAKEIGNGARPFAELSAYLTKVVQPIYADAPYEMLEMFFDFSSTGEFDSFEVAEDAKNMLQAYEAARAVGNVDRSFVDYKSSFVSWKHLQIETEVSLEKLRKGGYKTVAELTNFAEIALRNKIFAMVMSIIDATVVSGNNYSTGVLSDTLVNAMIDYMNEYSNEGMILATSGNINAITKVVPVTYLSDRMKEDYNRVGTLNIVRGVTLQGVARSAMMADGTLPISANTIFGICGKIGEIVNRGQMRVYSEQDIVSEKIHLKFTGVEFGVTVKHPELLFKHRIS